MKKLIIRSKSFEDIPVTLRNTTRKFSLDETTKGIKLSKKNFKMVENKNFVEARETLIKKILTEPVLDEFLPSYTNKLAHKDKLLNEKMNSRIEDLEEDPDENSENNNDILRFLYDFCYCDPQVMTAQTIRKYDLSLDICDTMKGGWFDELFWKREFGSDFFVNDSCDNHEQEDKTVRDSNEHSAAGSAKDAAEDSVVDNVKDAAEDSVVDDVKDAAEDDAEDATKDTAEYAAEDGNYPYREWTDDDSNFFEKFKNTFTFTHMLDDDQEILDYLYLRSIEENENLVKDFDSVKSMSEYNIKRFLEDSSVENNRNLNKNQIISSTDGVIFKKRFEDVKPVNRLKNNETKAAKLVYRFNKNTIGELKYRKQDGFEDFEILPTDQDENYNEEKLTSLYKNDVYDRLEMILTLLEVPDEKQPLITYSIYSMRSLFDRDKLISELELLGDFIAKRNYLIKKITDMKNQKCLLPNINVKETIQPIKQFSTILRRSNLIKKLFLVDERIRININLLLNYDEIAFLKLESYIEKMTKDYFEILSVQD